MKSVLIGVGQAGGKLAQAMADFDSRASFGAVLDALAVNSAKPDLQELSIDTMLVGQSRVNGHGVGGDNELGSRVMQEDVGEVLSALDGRVTAEAEAVFVVAGLGGGTGSGGAPVLVKELKRIYDVPVYVLGVLPGRSEGAMYQVNAGRSLKTVAREADGVLLVDNDAWQSADESVSEGYEAVNEAIAQRFGLLLAAGEAVEGVGESVVDTSEIINTLRSGSIAALGYASAAAADDASENVTTTTSVVRRALLSGSSLPDAVEASAALLVVAGNPDVVPRKGVERARRWVESETGSMEVRGGDFPLDSDNLAALVLLSGLEGTDRVDAFLERARLAAEETAEVEEAAPDQTEIWQNERIDDLL
ncbi:MAG: tubulin/FtsZ family protein [Haloferacaceae archaeon]